MMFLIPFAWIYSRGSDTPVDQMNIQETFTISTMLRVNNQHLTLPATLILPSAVSQRSNREILTLWIT